MDIKDIKKQLSIFTVLEHFKVRVDKNNRALCPFHDDKTPSLQVYPKTNTWCCFSTSCSAGTGDQIQFIELAEKCDKHEAIVKASEMTTGFASVKPLVSAAVQEKEIDPLTRIAVLTRMFNLFKSGVYESVRGKEYIKSRALDYHKNEIGYNGGRFANTSGREQQLIKSCVQLGLLSQANLKGKEGEIMYRAFGRACIVFALKNKDGQITGMYFRSSVNDSEQRHFYLKDRQGLYPLYPQEDTKKLILTESVIDAATLLQVDKIKAEYSVLALYGTNGLTDQHKQAITELKQLEEIVFAFDSDDAGHGATKKYSDEFTDLLPKVKLSCLELPQGEDINSVAQSHSDENIFIDLLEKRIFLSTEPGVPAGINSVENKNPVAEPQPEQMATVPEKPIAEQPSQVTYNKLNTDSKEQYLFNSDQLLITLFGGVSLQHMDRLRVTLYIRRNPHLSPVYSMRQTIDLYHHDSLEKFARQASEKTEVSTSHILETLAQLTEALEEYRIKEIEKKRASSCKPARRVLSVEEKTQALKNLENENLWNWTEGKLMETGIIGERENVLVLFYSMVSRFLESPVSVIALSTSGSGKSYLLERVARCFPADEVIENTQLTDNSLYYFRQDELKHKIMVIEDMDGAQNVEYAIRELISKKYITKTAVHKDQKGNLHTEQYRVEGPVAFFGCTTRESLYDDNANRVIPLHLDTGKTQDEKIMDYHKRAKAGSIDVRAEQQIRKQFRDMQQLLTPYPIINPYATLIDLPKDVLKPRRAIGIVFSFIEAITLYHQYQPSQREFLKNGSLQVLPDHIQKAFELLKEPLFRKSDELSGEVRNFLDRVRAFLIAEKRQSFYASDIRLTLKLHPRTLRNYLFGLREFGYLKITGGNKYRKGYEYELSETGKQETIRPGIDAHIEAMMKRIWEKHEQMKKGSGKG